MSSLQKSLHLSNDEDEEEKDGCDHMAQKSVTPDWLHDIAAALGLLTRVPVAVEEARALEHSAVAAWAYPVVGFFLGGLSLFVFTVATLIGLPQIVGVILVVAFNIIVTGGMHQDGLADSADGLWGGWTVERRLAIMKDSNIGVYGVCAISLSLILYVVTLDALAWHPVMALALFGAAALSRAMMVVLMYVLPNARGGGLSQSVGRPPAGSMWIALVCSFGGTLIVGLLVGHIWAAVLAVVLAGCAAASCAAIARRKIKGQTGDILGATQQISELTILIGLSAVVY